MKYMKEVIFITGLVILMTSCTRSDKHSFSFDQNVCSDLTRYVSIFIIDTICFKNELVSNGKIAAKEKAQLSFKKSGQIISKHYNNGEFVTKGTIIASLYNQEEILNLQLAREEVKRSKLRLNSLILGFCGKLSDSSDISRDIMDKFKIQSGFNNALLDLKLAEIKLNDTYLITPIDGLISDFTNNKYDLVNSGEVICSVLDISKLVVISKIHEPDVCKVKVGQKCKVVPFINDENYFFATIISVNPRVDRNGFVEIMSEIEITEPSSKKSLVDGMNVRIIVETISSNSIAVPKSAVVTRADQDIIFSLKNNRSKWNKIEVIDENSTRFNIKGDFKEGDTIIISGNINLTHNNPVKLK